MWRWPIEYAGIAVQVLLLLRSAWSHLLTKYYFFYTYIVSVILGSALLMTLLLRMPALYAKGYWAVQFVTLVAGYGILLEIMNHVLTPYPGAERFARTAGVFAFFVIFLFAMIAPFIKSQWAPVVVIEFERDLRSVQSLFLCVLLGVIFYYGIPIGRNMKGMILGYGLYIVTSLMTLAVRAYAGPSFSAAWKVIQPLSFDISLVIWLLALWSYCPNPEPDPNIPLEQDYEALASRTRGVIDIIRTYLRKAARA